MLAFGLYNKYGMQVQIYKYAYYMLGICLHCTWCMRGNTV